MKKYSIQIWLHDEWKPILGCPDRFDSRAKAERELRENAEFFKRRCRLVNSKGKAVLHAGINRD